MQDRTVGVLQRALHRLTTRLRNKPGRFKMLGRAVRGDKTPRDATNEHGKDFFALDTAKVSQKYPIVLEVPIPQTIPNSRASGRSWCAYR